MAVPWRTEQSSLESQPWRVLQLDGKEYLVKGLFEDTGYHVMLSDQSSVWEEKVKPEEVIQRSKLLNPHVEAPLSVILKNISSHILTLESDRSFSLAVAHSPTCTPSQPHMITLKLTTSLSSLPFQWEFTLIKAPLDSVSVHLVAPLLSMVTELSHRHQELVRLLVKKDREIQDYKEHGAEVSRKHLETVSFDERVFIDQLMSSSDFVKRIERPLGVFSHSASQELYKNVALVNLWTKRNNGASLITPSDTTPVSSLPSPTKSPLKTTTATVESPSKEDEQARREALEKKLENDKVKPKKKKRKLM